MTAWSKEKVGDEDADADEEEDESAEEFWTQSAADAGAETEAQQEPCDREQQRADADDCQRPE